MVGAARLELTTPRSQSECATNCATPRHIFGLISSTNILLRFLYLCKYLFILLWGEWWDSNPRPPEPQSGALPAELHPPCIL